MSCQTRGKTERPENSAVMFSISVAAASCQLQLVLEYISHVLVLRVFFYTDFPRHHLIRSEHCASPWLVVKTLCSSKTLDCKV
jgi:hypothetical protein